MHQLVRSVTCAVIFLSSSSVFAADADVTKYGAVGDGTTLNTEAIQKAIDQCNHTGGGKVIFPAGKFLSGTIALKDHITLYL
ncbi:glycosyl hydrolase family 28-related protein, partial [Pedobacter sp.]|uniref:glycosyl hydrolase family 28-related protein n=1 Tax=Pedobacter sp. TaxID=1411316 RepID=UPI002BCA36B6